MSRTVEFLNTDTESPYYTTVVWNHSPQEHAARFYPTGKLTQRNTPPKSMLADAQYCTDWVVSRDGEYEVTLLEIPS